MNGLAKNLRRGDDGRYRWHWDPRFLTGENAVTHTGADLQPRLDAAARRLDIPTLLVRGKLSELVGEAEAREFLSLVPHAEFVDVSEAGHMVAGDKNDVFTNAVLNFLDEAILDSDEKAAG